ncbi:MAG: SCO1664 family protein, partial [Candidatus Limnocylindrales bacterium]
VDATRARLDALLESARFPMPSADWPAVPWPPY